MSAAVDVGPARRHDGAVLWWISYLGVVGGGLMIAVYSRNRFDQPFLAMTLAMMALLVTAWFLRPSIALYVTLFLTLIGDDVTTAWFPFTKYFSSEISITFVSNGLSVSPLEISILTGLVVTTLRHYSRTGRLFSPNPLTRPILVFFLFVLYGFARGLSRGGDLRLAILEGRGLIYLVAVFLIVVNVCTDRTSYRRALWWVLAGTLVHSIFALEFLLRIPAAERAELESLVEHGASLPMNLVVVILVASLLFRGMPRWLTLVTGTILLPVGTVYLVSQRRAAVASLCVALGVMCLVLLWRQPKTFRRAMPFVVVVAIVYVGAFWTSQSAIGFPAQAIKSVVAPGLAAEEDRGSDQYRIFENIDINFTIRASPVLGIGMGQPFFRPLPLPAIADFTLARYVPHNSILWIWMKTGFLGFVSMLYLMAKALMLGARRTRVERDGLDMLLPLAGLLYVTMYMIFTYVDISWDARNTPLLGLALAICAFRPASRRNQSEQQADVPIPGSPIIQDELHAGGSHESIRLALRSSGADEGD